MTGGNGISLLAAAELPDLAEAGYTEAEYRVTGTAVRYTAEGDLPADGRFELSPGDAADYATRIVVRRPADAADFNGTVVLEWFNVSSGADVAPDYTYLADEIVRGGYAWVGVSAQHIGVEGGPVAVAAPGAELTGAGKGLKAFDPERYGDLSHPGDAFAYDLYTQVGRALRSPGDLDPLDGLDVDRLLAVGESQSAFMLSTYANGVQPLTHEFDGFLIHSRGGGVPGLGEPGAGLDVAGSIGRPPTIIRTDLDVPVMIVQTETDVLGIIGYYPARQDDTDRIRLWEIAGAAHADDYQVGGVGDALGCGLAINSGQQHVVLKAALRHLDTWASGGDAPPKADRLEVEGPDSARTFVLDDVGNVQGGIRTPAVDAPVDVLSGLPAPGASLICVLFGTTKPIAATTLAERYGTRADYLAAYEAATDAAIDAGFALPEDRDTILSEAQPDRLEG
ncbi:MAG: hypothetical protein KF703_16255 [Actinobacteria bacterium]|nr:hypothetical protein [Actinomycetota bacterium]